MRLWFALLLAALLAVPAVPVALPQQEGPPLPTPDLGELGGPLDELAGQVVPPALNTIYGALGQNVTREDIRLLLELNVTKGEVGFVGLILGSGKAEVQAKVHARLEMRVLSSDRLRALAEGENAYNVSAENATFLSDVYLPAEVFRASLTAEALALFQKEQEAALSQYLGNAVPELDVLGLEFAWSHVHPYESLTDTSLTEPPITLDVNAVVQYVRVESVPSLLDAYMRSKANKDEGKAEYIEQLKAENGDPLHSRDFFAAAAYTQLLNLSMQPGWSLDVNLSLPRGFSFTYFNEAVERHGERRASLHLDGTASDEDVQAVVLASITHKRAIATVLFLAVWVVGFVLAQPGRFVYLRRRLRPSHIQHR